MTVPAVSRLLLLRVLVELARELPPVALSSLISALEAGGEGQNLGRFAATQTMRERLRRLDGLRAQHPEIDGQAIALALRAAGAAAAAVIAEHHTEIAWTGPGTEAVPVRRVDQVLYDLVESAHSEVFVVTYAAYKIPRALSSLRCACDRGVHVSFVLELEEESGGKISFDELERYRQSLPSARFYYWPLERRRKSPTGSYGTMHAKCVVADGERALVSSANLTTSALESNMELGLLVGGLVSKQLREHFIQLIAQGELCQAR